MAVALRHIANLTNTASATLMECLNAYVFGNNVPQFYNPSKTYNRGALILSYNSTIKRFEILECTTDGTTSTYVGTKWKYNNVIDTIAGTIANFKLVQIKTTQPDDTSNIVWFQQKKIKTSIDPSIVL